MIVSPVVTVPFEDRIEALGTLRARESVALTAAVTETVSALYFDDGDRVEAGKVLAEMTSAEEHAQLEEARALWEAQMALRAATDEQGKPRYSTSDWAGWVLTGAPD